MSGTAMAAEIWEQPIVFERILNYGWPEIAQVAAAIKRRSPRFVLLVARGTSDHAAIYAKYLVEIRLGLPAGLMSASTLTIYDAKPNYRDVLAIAISQSGSSPDLLESLVRARQTGATTLAVTNAPESELAQEAEFHLEVHAGEEQAVAATKTYTAQLLTLYLLIEALRGGDASEAERLPDRARAVLDREQEVVLLANRYRFAERLVTTARGYNYATALETSLKLMETAYVSAQAFSAADLLHGPMAMVGGIPVIAVVPEGPGGAALKPILRQLRESGADTLVIGDHDAECGGPIGLRMTDLGPEVLTPMLLILPLQQLAWTLACERGNDPDRPRGLKKETQTW